MFIIRKIFISVLLLTVVGGMLGLNAKEKKYDEVVELGKVVFTDGQLNAANQSKINEYLRTLQKYEEKYKKVKLTIIGDTSCGSEDEEYADDVEDLFLDKGLHPKQMKVVYIRAKNGYADCTQQKVVTLILKAKSIRKIEPKIPKVIKPKIEMVAVLLDGRKRGTAIEVKTPVASVVVDKPNELVAITDDANISNPKEADTKELQELFGETLEASKVERYHFVLYFDDLKLNKKSQAKLKEIVTDIKSIDNAFIKIVGHTDTLMSVEENYKVGLERAQYVANLIKKSGVKYLKMDVTSFSELDLAVKTPDETKEPLNRRVEIFIQ
jgi:outer membrane protein OmpA-like peptidoglycan-associated protein